MKKFKSNEEGRCPFCDSENLTYSSIKICDGNLIYYSWTCNDCKNTGEEYYRTEFEGHNVNTNEGNIEITYDMYGDDE